MPERNRRKEPRLEDADIKIGKNEGKAYVHGVEGKKERCVLPCAQESKSPGEGKSWYLPRVEKKRRDKRSCLVIGFVAERELPTQKYVICRLYD
jgi:hypothetical protein